MKIKPLGKLIQIAIEEPKAGDLDMGGVKAAKEFGSIVALGPDVTLGLKVGDKVLFKSWADNIITENGITYHFIDQDTQAICAVVTK